MCIQFVMFQKKNINDFGSRGCHVKQEVSFLSLVTLLRSQQTLFQQILHLDQGLLGASVP